MPAIDPAGIAEPLFAASVATGSVSAVVLADGEVVADGYKLVLGSWLLTVLEIPDEAEDDDEEEEEEEEVPAADEVTTRLLVEKGVGSTLCDVAVTLLTPSAER